MVEAHKSDLHLALSGESLVAMGSTFMLLNVHRRHVRLLRDGSYGFSTERTLISASAVNNLVFYAQSASAVVSRGMRPQYTTVGQIT